MKHQLPALPYGCDALEPYIDSETMNIHHSKHHSGYVHNLNVTLERHPTLKEYTVEELLTNMEKIPEDIQAAIRNNAGGHFNHSLFWQVMSPKGGGEPSGTLNKAIAEAFGNFSSFKTLFEHAAITRFGSGWAWLCRNNEDKLIITSTPNQDSPITLGLVPILGLDVWEHAYYLKYQNRRVEYVSNWWNLVKWSEVAHRFEEAGVREAVVRS